MADQGEIINLKILSPSTEVEGGINLPDLPAATTVKELRQKIQDAAPTKPATERMRLIYRGRVVANDDDRLVDIFGSDSIRESKDQSLHLVLRELPTNVSASAPPSAPPSSTASPNPFRPASRTPQSPLQTNPFRALPQTRPASQPQVPQPQPHHHHHPHAHHHHHLPANPFVAAQPVPLPHNLLQQHLAQQQLVQNQLAQALAQNVGMQAQQTQALNTPPNPEAAGTNLSPATAESHVHHGPPASPNPNHTPNTTTRVVRHQGIGPNGERWTVTWNNTNVTIPVNPNHTANPQPNPRQLFHPPGFAVPFQRTPSPSANLPDQIVARARLGLYNARQRINRLTSSTQSGGEIPQAELNEANDAIRSALDQVRIVEEGLLSLRDAPTLAQNPYGDALQHFARELRNEAADMERILDRLRSNGSRGSAVTSNTPLAAPAAPAAPTASTPAQSQSDFPPQLFILSSPQGPVGLLFDQRGTYTTAPMMPALPFQTFNQQFAANRQLIAGIGQQIAQSSLQLPNSQGTAQPALPQQPIGIQPVPEQHQNPAQNQEQNQAQAPAANQNQPVPAAQPPEQDRVGVIAGHLWLVFKLACFVYFFAGGGSWYRPLMLGCVAGLVYLAQIGLFDAQFNMVRRHFEALLPLADRAVQPPNARNANAPNPRVEPDQNLTPETAAQRLVQQRHDQRFGWIRETMRSTERAFALFVASLWPGIGERMVQAQEERERAERAAEEERQRQREEEARHQEEDEKIIEELAANGQPASGGQAKANSSEAGPSASAKGKEKAVEGDTAN